LWLTIGNLSACVSAPTSFQKSFNDDPLKTIPTTSAANEGSDKTANPHQ